MIWFKDYSLEEINNRNKNTMVDHFGITVTKITANTLECETVITNEMKQPFGIVHGGMNCVLAETIGSIASNLIVDPKLEHSVGQTITTNHIKAVRSGKLKAIATPIHIGKKTHTFEIKTFNENNDVTSFTTLTMMVLKKLG